MEVRCVCGQEGEGVVNMASRECKGGRYVF